MRYAGGYVLPVQKKNLQASAAYRRVCLAPFIGIGINFQRRKHGY